MSTTSSLDSRISVGPYSVSLDSRISVDDYTNSLVCSNRITSCSSFQDHNLMNREGELSSLAPICFKRVPRQVNPKRLEYLTSEHQILIDVSRDCCQSSCLHILGKKAFKEIRVWYFSLNGEEQDTFLCDLL